jgi:hypothetical protein
VQIGTEHDEAEMAERLVFEIVPKGKAWKITENGTPATGRYSTREAVFEEVSFATSNALKVGLEISILIHSSYSSTPSKLA